MKHPIQKLASLCLRLAAGGTLALLRPAAGDVLVIAVPGGLTSDKGRAVATAFRDAGLRRGGTPVTALIIPTGSEAWIEAKRKPKEDLGYGETKNQAVDAGEQGKHVCGAPGPGKAA